MTTGTIFKPSRRGFLKGAGALGVPLILPSRVLFGQQTPSNTLQIGMLGCGRMARGHAQALCALGDVRISAVCDVDLDRARKMRKLIMEQQGASAASIAVFQNLHAFLRDGDFDAVVVATPDFQHGYTAAACILADKDVYLEKPCTLTLEEGQMLVRLVRERKRILQIGSQQRSQRQFYTGCELVRAGRIGRLKTIKIGLPMDEAGGSTQAMPVPTELDYDAWLGPLQQVFYTEDRVHPQRDFDRPGWLRWEKACLGMVTGWGSHHIDIAHWGMGMALDGPVKAEGQAKFLRNGLWDVHETFDVHLGYANGVDLHLHNTYHNGVWFEGDEGWIFVSRNNYRLEPSDPLAPRRALKALDASDKKLLEPLGPDAVRLAQTGSHFENWIDAIRTRRDPIAPVDQGHRSNSACILAHAAIRLGRPLRWNPKTETFVDDPAAEKFTAYAPRERYSMRTLQAACAAETSCTKRNTP